jgi:hypothetical protein
MNANMPLIERFKSCIQVLPEADLSLLREMYTDDVVFKDPVHEIRGLVGLEDYFATLISEMTDCRFEYLDEIVGDRSAYVKWMMHYRHPRLGNRLVSVRGVSHLRFGDKIEFHEDVYDMGAMLYEQVPLLGNVTRWLRLRLAS